MLARYAERFHPVQGKEDPWSMIASRMPSKYFPFSEIFPA